MAMLQETVARRIDGHVKEATAIEPRLLAAHDQDEPLERARALFVWTALHVRPQTDLASLGGWLGGRTAGAVRQLHLKAVVLRMIDPHFKALTRRIEAAERREGEVPYGCD